MRLVAEKQIIKVLGEDMQTKDSSENKITEKIDNSFFEGADFDGMDK